MSWKQPVPTDINDNRNFTAFDRAVFREILCLCQSKDYVSNFIHAERAYSVELKRGQCIFKVRNYAKEMKVDRKRIQKSIATLSKWYTEMDTRAMPYGLIITVKNYDEITKMESGMESSGTIEGPKRDHRRATNKSNKIDKIVKKENNLLRKLQKKKISFDWVAKYPMLENDELKQTLTDFKEFRKAMRKPLTENATKLILNKLIKLAGDDLLCMKAILEQSMERGWAGIFELDAQKQFPKTFYRQDIEDKNEHKQAILATLNQINETKTK